LLFIETSARTGANIESAFALAAEEIHRKFQASAAASPTAPGGMPDAKGGGLMKRGGRSAVRQVTQGEVQLEGTTTAAAKGCCTIV
jgi:hypothetical protein